MYMDGQRTGVARGVRQGGPDGRSARLVLLRGAIFKLV